MSDAPIFFAKADNKMNDAFRKAQQNFRYFWREQSWEYRRIIPGLGMACVKVAFSQAVDGQEPMVEHMWINEVTFDGEIIRGVLLNEPNQLTNVSRGEQVAIPLSHLSDWLFSRNEKVFGGFTIQAMRSEMSARERKEHDKAWGFDFGDPNEILVAAGQVENPEYLVEHPMSVNMKEKIVEFLAENPGEVTGHDINGNTMLHHEAIAGNRTSVEALVAAGADIQAKNNKGKTAYDYAMEIGWPHLLPLLEIKG